MTLRISLSLSVLLYECMQCMHAFLFNVFNLFPHCHLQFSLFIWLKNVRFNLIPFKSLHPQPDPIQSHLLKGSCDGRNWKSNGYILWIWLNSESMLASLFSKTLLSCYCWKRWVKSTLRPLLGGRGRQRQPLFTRCDQNIWKQRKILVWRYVAQ